MKKEKTFRQTTYRKRELACLYYPHITPGSAVRKLSKRIKAYYDLHTQLKAFGYRPKTHILTPKQVHIITDYLGIP